MITYCVLVGIDTINPDIIGFPEAILTVDIMLNVILIFVFVSKLRQSVMLRLRADTGSMSIDDALDQSSHVRIMDVMTKQMVNGTSLVGSSTAFLMTTAIMAAFFTDSESSFMFAYSARAMEGTLISCLLYLGLYVNDSIYRKLCGFSHRYCYHCAMDRFKRKITNEYRMDQKVPVDFL